MYSSSRSRVVQELKTGFGDFGKIVSRSQENTPSQNFCRLHLGGQIPPSIDISCPIIDTRLKLEIAAEDIVNLDRAYGTFSVQKIINLVRQSMISADGISSVASRDWKCVIEQQLQTGKRLELNWRLEAQLDWVWQTEDVQGSARPWAVLSGLPLNQVCIAIFRISRKKTVTSVGEEGVASGDTYRRTFSKPRSFTGRNKDRRATWGGRLS